MQVLTLERKSVNRLNEDITRRKIRSIVRPVKEAVNVGRKVNVATVSDGYVNSISIRINRDDPSILAKITERASKIGWALSDGQPQAAFISEGPTELITTGTSSKPPFKPPELTPDAMERYFGDIYEREAHIRLIQDSVNNFISSGAKLRSHVLLFGEPSAAKSSLFKKFVQWYDESENNQWNRIMKIDGHTTSKAGLENTLISLYNNRTMPEILLIEEIEKRDKLNDLDVLISIMQDGYLAKLNARQDSRIETPFLVWATCNDYELLKKVRNGAIWSRFSHKWQVYRPNPTSMKKILEDSIIKSKGNLAWVEPIMSLAYDDLKISDPREILSLLDGRDRLLTGEYRKDILEVVRHGK